MKQPDQQLKTVYDEQGVAHLLESVDAREYLETGRYFSEPPAKVEAPAPESTDKPAKAAKG